MSDTYLERFHIRTATIADIPALRALIERSVRGLQGSDYTQAQMDGALGHALGLDTQLVADATYFVATPAGAPHTIAGSGGWSFRKTLFGSDGGPNRTAAELNPETDAAKVRAIFVDPAFARQGLGSLILKHCENAAQAAGFKRVEMGSTLTGLTLYRLKGYLDAERVEVPLPNGESLSIVHMTKTLR
jgi:N-acetylglutamate synthase-like GNAT family acetyltransferase